MRHSFKLRSLITASFAVSTLLGLSACSGSAEEDETLAVSSEEAEAQGSADNATAVETAPAVTETTAAVAPPMPMAEPAATSAPIDKNRVVRFVSEEQATIASEPHDGAAVVGKLVKGDKVLIVEQNGWGKIADGMFVNLKHLSHKGVPAERLPAQWTPPAH